MTETTKAKRWDESHVSQLLSIVGEGNPVSVELVEKAAAALDVSARSVAAKLRQMDRDVASMAKEKVAAFTPEQGDALAKFVNDNNSVYTYKEIAEKFPGGFSAKQIQGKVLALELTSMVKPAEKVEVARVYTDAEEATFIQMAQAGKYIEDIANVLGKTIPSVRGKALSLNRKGQIDKIPAQKDSHAKNVVDAVAALGASITTMTVEQIATAVDKTTRGLKTLLTRRGLDCADYKGSQKKAKAEGKAAVAA